MKNATASYVWIPVIVIALIGGYLLFSTNQDLAKVNKEETDYQLADKDIKNLKLQEAFSILSSYQNNPTSRWKTLWLEYFALTHNGAQLATLYEQEPALFKGHEKAALIAADQFINQGNPNLFFKIQDDFQKDAQFRDKWLLLEADALILNGNSKQAIHLLTAHTLDGSEETARLLRLALLNLNEHPKISWGYLLQATKNDPHNPDIRTYRAKILEKADKIELAAKEYTKALQLSPHNPYLTEQVADFYVRNKNYKEALKTWKSALSANTSDQMWIQAYFWNKMVAPIAYDWKNSPLPNGKDRSFIDYLVNLQPNQFWDEAAFEKALPMMRNNDTNLQVVFWLRLANELQKGNEKGALVLLEQANFRTSWSPDLQNLLTHILHYRIYGPEEATSNPYFNAEFYPLLKSKEVYTAAFLSSGWDLAAINLHKVATYPNDFPEWLAPAMTEAYKRLKNESEAIAFAQKQNQTPQLKFMIAEMLLSKGKKREGIELLKTIAKTQSDFGAKAAWLVVLDQMESKDYANAATTILSQPYLANSLKGQELLARIALYSGDENQAAHIYEQIASDSKEAQSYLAKKAFNDKDWPKAKALTEKLLIAYPSNQLLQENLRKIEQAAASI